MTAPILEVRDLRHRYGSTTALAGASFHVAEGELFGLLGPNGAGKTTLLSAVSCLLTPDAGEIRLLGEPLSTRDLKVRRLIGLVPQELAIYNDLSARENLLFLGELYGIDRSTLTKRANELLAVIGLLDRADDRTSTFSGGMKRRLNLGAGLIHSPRLLLLDEPTVGVDPQSRNLVFEEVRRLNAGGVTVVYTSHYMEEVQALCTRIGIMDRGRVIACDTLPNLLRLKEGSIRFRTTNPAPALRLALDRLPDCQVKDESDGRTRLICHDVKGTLLRLGALFHETATEPLGLETDEPNLEGVFLHLTGRGLRD
jgi:ABC-2 type transport system ATP-binding protein